MDNRYYKYGCPPLMSDQRFLTNYIHSRTFDQMIRNINSIDSIQDYKCFLQKNTDEILNKERQFLSKNYTCSVNGNCVPISNNVSTKTDYLCNCPKRYVYLPDERHMENTCAHCRNINCNNSYCKNI